MSLSERRTSMPGGTVQAVAVGPSVTWVVLEQMRSDDPAAWTSTQRLVAWPHGGGPLEVLGSLDEPVALLAADGGAPVVVTNTLGVARVTADGLVLTPPPPELAAALDQVLAVSPQAVSAVSRYAPSLQRAYALGQLAAKPALAASGPGFGPLELWAVVGRLWTGGAAELWRWTATEGWVCRGPTPALLIPTLGVHAGRLVALTTVDRAARVFEYDGAAWTDFPVTVFSRKAKDHLLQVFRAGPDGSLIGNEGKLLYGYGGRGGFAMGPPMPSVTVSFPCSAIGPDGAWRTVVTEWDAAAGGIVLVERRLEADALATLAAQAQAAAGPAPKVKAAPKAKAATPGPKKPPAGPSKLVLDRAGRLSFDDPSRAVLPNLVVAVGARVVVLASEAGGRRCVLVAHANVDGQWREVAAYPLPFGDTGASVSMVAWGPDAVMVHRFRPEDGHATCLVDLSSGRVTATADAAFGRPVAWSASGTLHVDYLAREAPPTWTVCRPGQEPARLVPPDGSALAGSAAIVSDSVWVAAPGDAPRRHLMHAWSLPALTHRTTAPVATGAHVVLSAVGARLVVGSKTSTAVGADGTTQDVGALAPGDGWRVSVVPVGDSVLATRAEDGGGVAWLDASFGQLCTIELPTKLGRFLGAQVAATGDTVALTVYAPPSHAVYLLRVEGDRLAPANVFHDDRTPAERFEAAYPGFLALGRGAPSPIKAWQVSLAVHEALVEAGELPAFDLRRFAALYPTRRIDPERSALVPEACRYVAFAAASKLDRVVRLVWDGPVGSAEAVYPYWDGEDATFDVDDLRGIEACAALEHLDLCVGGPDGPEVDLKPLAGLPRLSHLVLRGGRWKGLAALVKAPGLRQVELVGGAPDAATIAALVAAGVGVITL
jgi:hypothetical protein